jgi:hypothetical protein
MMPVVLGSIDEHGSDVSDFSVTVSMYNYLYIGFVFNYIDI